MMHSRSGYGEMRMRQSEGTKDASLVVGELVSFC